MTAPNPVQHLALFEASPTPMLLVDHEAGVIVEANPAATRFYGYAQRAMSGLAVTALSEEAPARLDQVAGTASGALSFAVDHRLASGDIRRVEIGSTMVEIDGRRLVYSVIRPADEVVAERTISELRESERRYRELVEQLGAGVVLFSPLGEPTWLNETMASMLGYSRDELLRLGYGVIVNRPAPTWSVDDLAALTAAGSMTLDLVFRHRDGRLLTGEVRIRRVPDDTIEAVVHDVTAQRAASAQLAASEERYRLLVEQAFDGIVVIGPDRHVQHINPTACAMLGVEPGALGVVETLERSAEIEADAAEREAKRARLLAGEEVAGFAVVVRPDGSTLSLEQRARLRPDGSVVAVLRDVTAAREAQQALQRSEARVREYVESMDDFVIVYDRDGRITYVNPAVIRETGLAADQILGHDTVEFFAAGDLAQHLEARTKVLGGESHQREFRLRRADGSTIWIDGRAHRMPDGSVETIGRVITNRKALESERDRLALALDQSSDVIVLTDLHGITQYVNRAFERMYGLPRAEAIGFRSTKWFVRDPGFEAPARIFSTLRATGHWRGDVRQRRHDGTVFTASARLAVVRSPDGEPIGFVGIATDVTRERAIADRMAESARIEAVRQLAGGVAHDFNNLLTGVLGYAQLAASTPPDDPAIATDLREIMDAAERAQALTRQLLAFGRRATPDPRVLDPGAAVLALEPALRQLAGEHVALVVETRARIGRVRVDPALLEDALVGLVENAREAMPDGGPIHIVVGNPEPGDDAPPGDWTAIRVIDGGAGMDAETQARAVEPFFSTKAVTGAGFGLTMANSFVVQSGGHLRVRSVRGQGTAVTLLLPIDSGLEALPTSGPVLASGPGPVPDVAPEAPPRSAAGPDASGPAAAPGAPPRTGSATILVVDDEAVLRAIAERVMVLAGHRVLVAGSGEEALAIAASAGPIDLLFTDVVMPGMHGIALATALRAERPGLRVLVTSGYTPDDVDRRGVGLADTPFLPKPYTPAQLTETVAALLAQTPGE